MQKYFQYYLKKETKTVLNVDERLVTIEATLLIQKGQIEILLGLISSRIGKDDLMKYLEFVVNSPDFGDSAKISAQEMMIHQNKLWNSELSSGQKQ